MSVEHLPPPPQQVDEFNYIWKNWFNLVYRYMGKRTYSLHLTMSNSLSPSINPMADGLIGIVPVALADDTKDESRNLGLHIPENWVEGTDITVHFHIINTTAQTGITTVITEMTYISIGHGDVANGAGTSLSITYSLPTGVSANINHDGPTFTIPASALTKGDRVFIKVLRNGSTDTAVGDIGYDGIHVEYTGYINHE